MRTLPPSSVISAAVAAIAMDNTIASGAEVNALLEHIRSKDDKVRSQAWQGAAGVGAPAIAPLAALLVDAEVEVGRAARHAIERIVHHAGRPGAADEAHAVERELIALLKQESPAVRRLGLWMLSEIGGDNCVQTVAGLLADPQVRDDARCALQRIPGQKSIEALSDAMARVSEDFRFAIAESLRKRGQAVDGYPSKKLLPTPVAQQKAAALPSTK